MIRSNNLKSIYWKVLSKFLVIALIVFIFLFYISNNLVKKMTNDIVIKLQRELIQSKADEMSNWLEARIDDLDIISENSYVKEMNIEKSLSYLSQIQKSKNNIYESFSLTDIEGNTFVSDGSKFNIVGREYYKKIFKLSQGFNISKPIISNSNKKNIIIFTRCLLNDKGNKIGYLNGAILIDNLSEIASNIQVKGQKSWILDNDTNQIIAHYANHHINDVLINPYPRSNINDTDYVFFSKIENSPNWSLGINIPKNKIYEEYDPLMNAILYSGIILCILILLTSFFFTNSITKPIKSLKSLMQKVETGNFTTRFKMNTYKEIEELGNTFNHMIETIDNLIKENKNEQKRKREAELKALYSQIQPHFLYNTLDTIQYMALDHDAYDVVDAISNLTNIFRISLSKDTEIITLEEELQHIKSYLFIQKLRYEDKLNYDINCPPDLLQSKVLKLVIQPLVENSIYHGIKLIEGKGYINIDIKNVNNTLYIKVSDNGRGIDKEKLSKLNSSFVNFKDNERLKDGYGLFNVNERIKLTFGEKYGLVVTSKENEETSVIINHPIIRGSDEYAQNIDC